MKLRKSGTVSRTRGRAMLGVTVAALALLAGACGSSSKKTATAPATTTATTAGTTTTVAPTVTSASSTKLGAVLVNSKGFTLYTFDPENSGGIKCLTSCVAIWPPALLASGVTTPTAGPGITVSLATIARPDGGTQITADGHPLYLFAKDTAAGDTNGDGVAGKWHAAKPTGASAGATTSSSG